MCFQLQGDGSPMPANLEERGRNLQENDRRLKAEKSKPFSVQFEVDVVQFLLTLAALGTRLWMLGHPRAVVYVNNLHIII